MSGKPAMLGDDGRYWIVIARIVRMMAGRMTERRARVERSIAAR